MGGSLTSEGGRKRWGGVPVAAGLWGSCQTSAPPDVEGPWPSCRAGLLVAPWRGAWGWDFNHEGLTPRCAELEPCTLRTHPTYTWAPLLRSLRGTHPSKLGLHMELSLERGS